LLKQTVSGAIRFQVGKIGITIIQMNLFSLFTLHGPYELVTLMRLFEALDTRIKVGRAGGTGVNGQRIKGNAQANAAT
jgi:hypothetical protein